MNKRTGISSESELVDDDTVGGGRTNPDGRLGKHRRQCFGGFDVEYVQQKEEEEEEGYDDGETGDEHNNHAVTVMGTTCNSGEANEGAVQNEDDERATEAEVEDQDDDFVEKNDDVQVEKEVKE